MPVKKIHTVVVCGAGTMGSGIAETAARSGFSTILYDPVGSALKKAEDAFLLRLQNLVDKEKISPEERREAMERIHFTPDPSRCVGDIVIEAVVEDAEVKKELFAGLAARNQETTILASNTSSLSITQIAKDIPHRERVCGLHFFNPAQVMKLVELVTTEWTEPEIVSTATAFLDALGKTTVLCKDAPGFIVNRVARPFYLEALRLMEKGQADPETIDRVLENAGFKLGPFRLMDLIGNDINLAVTRSLYEACGRPPRFRPSAVQEQKVVEGALGRKTGHGFYNY